MWPMTLGVIFQVEASKYPTQMDLNVYLHIGFQEIHFKVSKGLEGWSEKEELVVEGSQDMNSFLFVCVLRLLLLLLLLLFYVLVVPLDSSLLFAIYPPQGNLNQTNRQKRRAPKKLQPWNFLKT